MKQWNEQQRAAIRRQSKEQLARDYETFAIQSTTFMRQRDELLEACQNAKQLLDALRMDSGIGDILTESQRELYQSIDAKLTAAIAKATGENAE